jgi:hypothetical protein
VIRGCRFLISWIKYLNIEMKEGLRGQSHLWWDNYEDGILFMLEMSDYNQNLRIFYPRFTMRNVLVKLLVMELKLTKIKKFIGITWLLHKAYSEMILRSIVCMHIKSSLFWESSVMRLRIDMVLWMNERSIKWNKFQVLQLSED